MADLIAVRVTQRGGRDAIEGWTRDVSGRPVLKVRVAAAAADGQANEAVITLLGKALRRPKSQLSIVSGQAARLKRVAIENLSDADLNAAFGAAPP